MALTKIKKSVLSTNYVELGLGNVSLQDKETINIDGGNIDGVVLGSSNPVTLISTGINDSSLNETVCSKKLVTASIVGSLGFTVDINNATLSNLIDMTTVLNPGDSAIVSIAVGTVPSFTNLVSKITLLVQRSNSAFSVSVLGTQPNASVIDESASGYLPTINSNYGNILKIKINYSPGIWRVKGQFLILPCFI